jgi:hypothetical protein
MMRRSSIRGGLAALALAGLAGCGGSDSAQPAAEAARAPAAQSTRPENVPDRQKDPEAFWTWRVDRMFEENDVDRDGKLVRDEFRGQGVEFKAMDVDGDAALTKKEVMDRVLSDYAKRETAPTP